MYCSNIFLFCLTVSLLKDLKHANIVTLHDIVHTPKSLTLVFEYLVSGTDVPLTLFRLYSIFLYVAVTLS